MYSIELSNDKTKAIIDTVKFKRKKDAEEWLKDFRQVLTKGTMAKVIKL
jgi:hypothetical protein